MVNRGPSRGCHTCKARRVRCDEGRPTCQTCQRLGFSCAGYEKKPLKLRFKIQVASDAQQPQIPASYHPNAVAARTAPAHSPSYPEPDLALGFFFNYFVDVGRTQASTRGFFEALPSVVTMEPRDSAATAAVTALATRMLTLWRGDARSFTVPHPPLGAALARLGSALQNPDERQNPATPFAAIILQFYENMNATYGFREASRTHHDGAVAMFMRNGLGITNESIGLHVVRRILHSEVSYRLQSGTAFPTDMEAWIRRNLVIDSPTSTLDLIGVSIANLQYASNHISGPKRAISTSERTLHTLLEEVDDIEHRLLEWPSILPSHWAPVPLPNIPDALPPIPTYAGECHIYPASQVAAIWNIWRSYQLILLKIKLAILHCQTGFSSPAAGTPPDQSDDVSEAHITLIRLAQERVQEILDAVCHSVPFHVGNRFGRGALSDVTNPTFVHPSYFDLDPTSEPFLRYKASDNYMSYQSHRGHMVMQGPWHMMMCLGSIMNLLSGQSQGTVLLSRSLRPGQIHWLRKQFVRTSALVALELPKSRFGDAGPEPPSPDPKDAELLVAKVREGLKMTSGL
ncbi:hypothetical protein GQ53DRAFT_793642 [Thozetella sp. PMI_491]|nr:hypothetical protein GQ53DRAFT_793642 [Thozetella sp. PMI_491]